MSTPGWTVTLVRHGETEWSRSLRHTGRVDVALTEAGRTEAREVGERLRGNPATLVLCSPLRRAQETCQLAGFADRSQLRPDLAEWNYGDYEGLTTPAILASRPDWWLWHDGCPGGESPGQIQARADAVLAELRSTAQNALLFAHGHILRVLAARWIGLSAIDGSRLALDTAAISVLGWERETAVLRHWNDRSYQQSPVLTGT